MFIDLLDCVWVRTSNIPQNLSKVFFIQKLDQCFSLSDGFQHISVYLGTWKRSCKPFALGYSLRRGFWSTVLWILRLQKWSSGTPGHQQRYIPPVISIPLASSAVTSTISHSAKFCLNLLRFAIWPDWIHFLALFCWTGLEFSRLITSTSINFWLHIFKLIMYYKCNCYQKRP